MNQSKTSFWTIMLMLFISIVACRQPSKPVIDIRPHQVLAEADTFYQEAIELMMSSYDIDSAYKCIRLLDEALRKDSLNPDYYGMKAKLYAELGELDSALSVQLLAVKKRAMNGDYWFQLGLYQAAKELKEEAHESFGKALDYLQTVLDTYPDSLQAFIYAEAAHALYEGQDSLFMHDLQNIRKRFPNRLMEIEMTRRIKPHALIREISSIAVQKENQLDFDLDSLVNATMEKQSH